MKKLFTLIAVALMAVCLSSCKKDAMSVDPSSVDDTVYKCWHYTVSYTYAGVSASEEAYTWSTERQLVETLQLFKGTGVKATYEATSMSEAACEEADYKVHQDE